MTTMVPALRLLPLLAVAFAASADAPAPPSGTAAALAADDDIRNTFVGRAACPPPPSPVGTGPYEFRADGAYMRAQDVASAHGRYAVADGKICVILIGSERADFCLAVLKDAAGYSFRLDPSAAQASRHEPVRVTPCDPSAAR